jgi:cupin 2 domain-containing protein
MQSGNLFTQAPATADGEVFDELLRGGSFRLERIVSTGQATPPGQWLDQDADEWVVLLAGRARLRLADPPREIDLAPGDWLLIPAHTRHRVEWTEPQAATVWLALHSGFTSRQQ